MITLTGFVDFIRSKGGEEYDYTDTFECPLAQYLKTLGYTWVVVGSTFFCVAKVEGEDTTTHEFGEVFGDLAEKVDMALAAYPRRFDFLRVRLERVMS